MGKSLILDAIWTLLDGPLQKSFQFLHAGRMLLLEMLNIAPASRFTLDTIALLCLNERRANQFLRIVGYRYYETYFSFLRWGRWVLHRNLEDSLRLPYLVPCQRRLPTQRMDSAVSSHASPRALALIGLSLRSRFSSTIGACATLWSPDPFTLASNVFWALSANKRAHANCHLAIWQHQAWDAFQLEGHRFELVSIWTRADSS